MQVFENTAQAMKQQMNQIHQARYPARKARPAKKPFDESEFVQNKPRFFKVAAKIPHRADRNGYDFRVRDFDANIFGVSARLEKIINKTVYCKSAVAHIKSSPLFLSG